jgi:ADP-heptose:LPS heptosyltransferase
LKILVIRFSSIGDIVLTTPVVRVLAKQLPKAEIHYCTKKSFASIVQNNPYVNKVHILDGKLNDLISDLKKENFDYVIDLHNNLRSFIIKTRLGVESSSFKKENFLKWLLVKFKYKPSAISHVTERYLATTSKLGIVDDGEGLDYFIPEKDIVNIDTLPPIFQQGFLTYAIGGQHGTKQMPVHKMIEFCSQVTRPIILLGGKEDFDNAEKIIASCENKVLIYNACGKYNLNQSASLLQQARQVITHDTGLMHIASALRKNIISIWGNTVPALGFTPYKVPFTAIEANNVSCRPCSKLGYAKCPKGHFDCMEKIDVKDILLAIK